MVNGSSNETQVETSPKTPCVWISQETRAKLGRIAGVKRWKLNVAVDALCDHFLATDPQMQAAPTDPGSN